jgi:hypothetical protein
MMILSGSCSSSDRFMAGEQRFQFECSKRCLMAFALGVMGEKVKCQK